MAGIGSRKYVVRFPEELEMLLEEQVHFSSFTRRGEPWTVSEFIRIAVREKIQKMFRSRTWKRKTPVVPLSKELMEVEVERAGSEELLLDELVNLAEGLPTEFLTPEQSRLAGELCNAEIAFEAAVREGR
jgi:hypothetical protein